MRGTYLKMVMTMLVNKVSRLLVQKGAGSELSVLDVQGKLVGRRGSVLRLSRGEDEKSKGRGLIQSLFIRTATFEQSQERTSRFYPYERPRLAQ